nr:MAG TPA: hypothetical protein [Herelleviridae sp.]
MFIMSRRWIMLKCYSITTNYKNNLGNKNGG